MSEPVWYWVLVAAAWVGFCRCAWLLWRQRRWSIRRSTLRETASKRLLEDILWNAELATRAEYRLALTLRAHRLAAERPVPLRLIHTTVGEL